MHCRAYLLLEREYSRIQKNPEWGIEVTPSESNIFCWYATICGLSGSIWENGCFHVTIRFNENYDDEPPEIKFNTVPFHPNINPLTGEACIDLYAGGKNRSSRGIAMGNLLVNLQALLSNPILDEAVNPEAANLLRTAPHIYMQLVKNCVSESKKLIEVLRGQDLEKTAKGRERVEFFLPKKATSSACSYARRPKQVSFDEYHKHWVRLASSQPLATMSLAQPYTAGNGDPYLQDGHHLYRRASSASPSAVGRTVAMDTEQKMSKLRQKKIEKIAAMKQLYLSKSEEAPSTTAPQSSRIDSDIDKMGEPWENEANDLVAWTTTLEADSV